jgi:hypothetical protein
MMTRVISPQIMPQVRRLRAQFVSKKRPTVSLVGTLVRGVSFRTGACHRGESLRKACPCSLWI